MRHYLDHASTSPPRPEVVEAMVSWLEGSHTSASDPGRVHTEGRIARQLLEDARDQVAAMLKTRPRQVIFNSGATESINSACFGAATAHPNRPIALAGVEHSSVRQASERLADITLLGVDSSGRILLDDVERAISDGSRDGDGPALVHCQLGNHEVGTLQPVKEVVELCRRRGVLVHVDAAAAVGHVDVDTEELGADLLSVSAHKFGGPPGIGALVVRRGLRLPPFVVGGDQERARRAGLENLPAAIGFAAAATALEQPEHLRAEELDARRRISSIVDAATAVSGVTVLGDPTGLPHIAAFAVEGVEAEPIVLALDRAGIAVHSGSSCSSETLAPSPVLEAMGADAEHSIRVSVGWSTGDSDIEAFALEFPRAVAELRSLRS